MNYTKIYDLIIEKSKTIIFPSNIYTEKHHIVPKCMNELLQKKPGKNYH
jgi:hypothetical protein